MTTKLLLILFGGMALLLYGMQLTGEGLQRAAGARLRQILTHLTSNRVMAALTGAGVTALIQSSTATTIMLIGFVQAGLLSLHQAMGIILGADVGTTFTVQLLAFHLYDYAPLMVGLGFSAFFFAKRRLFKDLGQAAFGFGLIFLGLKLMIEGMEPLKDSPLTAQVLLAFAESPILGIAAAAVFTAVVASSAATIGLAIALAAHGLLPLAGAVSLVLGANVGTCATALTASLGSTTEARRVAVAHIGFKLLGVAAILPFLGGFVELAARSAHDLPRQIANAHTFFNVGISLLFLPFQGLAARLIVAAVPDRPEEEARFRTRYLDERFADQPSLALGQAQREALRMADIVQGMFRDAAQVFRSGSQELLEDVEHRDDQADYLEREIKLYLTRLSRQMMTEDLAQREIALLGFIGNLENIGDIIDKNLMDLARKKLFQGRRFSEPGEAELMDFHAQVSKNLERAIVAFAAGDRVLAQEVLEQRATIRQRERDLRQSHLDRLRAGLAESLETSEIHLDVLTNLKRINSHITAIVYPILEQ
ncbi:MAG TPA: Na/Pi cotransporter family protein [Methylomirabilota bacterium]|jgi:phosphate:Na+ symporter|nr:Na/Pi cotransporter family protein [Methylomirabilota bacterium]